MLKRDCPISPAYTFAGNQTKEHMRKLSKIMMVFLASWTLFVQSGCYGSFELTKKLWEWNGSLTESKFVHTLVFWVLNIIPVYGVCGFIDVVIFNLIEFWSGNNPIAMKEGDYEQQIVTKDGVTYKMEATRNRFTITNLDGKEAGKVTAFVYRTEDNSWNVEKDGELVTIARLDDRNGMPVAHFTGTNGEVRTITLPSNEESLAAMKQSLHMQNVAVK